MQPGPYNAPPPSAGRLDPLSPSGWWYVLGITVGVAGICLAIGIGVATFTAFVDHINDFVRIDVPGTETVTLDAGKYIVFLEYPGAGDDFSTTPSVDFNITDPDGDPVAIASFFGSQTYNADSHEGEALFTFTAQESGRYTVSSEGEFATIAIGEGLFGGLFAGIAGAAASAFIGVVAALVIMIITAIRRSSSRTRRQLSLVQPSAPGYPPGAPAYPSTPGYPPGTPGYPSGTPGYPPSTTEYPPGWPGTPGAPGTPSTWPTPAGPGAPPSWPTTPSAPGDPAAGEPVPDVPGYPPGAPPGTEPTRPATEAPNDPDSSGN